MGRRLFKFSALALAGAVFIGGAGMAVGQPAPSAQPDPQARVTAINDSDYAAAMMRLIPAARHSIEICIYQAEFYTEHPDSASNAMIDALIAAAGRGVMVTAIIDRSAFRGDHDSKGGDVAERLARGGVMVLMDPDEVQSHQKLAIFDRAAVVVSSTNWTHYALTSNTEAGVIVWSRQTARAFSHYFAGRMADASFFQISEDQIGGGMSQVVTPEALRMRSYEVEGVELMNNRWFLPNLTHAIRNATKSVDLIQRTTKHYDRVPRDVEGRPSEMPAATNLLLDELIAAKRRGLRVRVLVDSTWSESWLKDEWDASQVAFAKRLADAGIEVFVDDPERQLHAKMLVIDEDEVVIGSTNWTFEALEVNNEASVLVRSQSMVERVYRQWVDAQFAAARPFTMQLPNVTGAGA